MYCAVQYDVIWSTTGYSLLGGKVKVEPSLEPVELELTGREEPLGGGGGGDEGGESGLPRLLGTEGGLNCLLHGLGGLSGLESGLVTGQESGVGVGSVEGVDEGVDAGTVGAVGHGGQELVVHGAAGLGAEVGSVGVELEVTVGGVVGVDEGVEVGVHRDVNVVVVEGSGYGGGGDRGGGDKPSGGLGRGRGSSLDTSLGRVEGSRVESVGSVGHVSSLQDPESVLTGSVSHGDGLTVVTDVAVLANTLAVGGGLLPEDGAVLLGVGGAEAAIASVEALLLQDLGVLGVHELTGGRAGQAGCYDKLEHGECE